MDIEKILARLVQTGAVSAVDAAKKRARVLFPDTHITSGWLYVLQHDLNGAIWLPKVNDQVLVIYLPVFNSDGFIVGGF